MSSIEDIRPELQNYEAYVHTLFHPHSEHIQHTFVPSAEFKKLLDRALSESALTSEIPDELSMQRVIEKMRKRLEAEQEENKSSEEEKSGRAKRKAPDEKSPREQAPEAKKMKEAEQADSSLQKTYEKPLAHELFVKVHARLKLDLDRFRAKLQYDSSSVETLPLDRRRLEIQGLLSDGQRIIRLERQLKQISPSELSLDEQAQKQAILQEYVSLKHSLKCYSLYKVFSLSVKRLASDTTSESTRFFPWDLSRLEKALDAQFSRYLPALGVPLEKAKIQELVANKPEWRRIRDTAIRMFMEKQLEAAPVQRALGSRSLTWISGSQSSSLPLILKRTLPHLKPSLIPSGILLRHNIAPLCGELGLGLIWANGVNRESLSGCDLANWQCAAGYSQNGIGLNGKFSPESAKAFVLSILPPNTFNLHMLLELRIAILRLIQMNSLSTQEKDKMIQDLTTLRNELSQNEPQKTEAHHRFFSCVGMPAILTSKKALTREEGHTIGTVCACPNEEGKDTHLFGVIGEVLPSGEVICSMYNRAKKTFPESLMKCSDEDLEKAQASLQMDAKEKEEKEMWLVDKLRMPSQEIDQLIDALHHSSSLELTQQERSFIEHPFPIIWASSTESGGHVRSDCQGEIALRGPQELGEKIQFLFVSDEHIEEMKQYLQDIPNLHVFSDTYLPYLYEDGCSFNGYCVYPKGRRDLL